MSASSMNPFESAMGHITKGHGTLPGASPATKAPPKPPDKTLGKSSGGGGGKPKPKSAADEAEDADEKAQREQANKEPPENPVDRTVVKITHIQWDKKKADIGGSALLSMDVEIPPEHKHLTRITLSLEQQMHGGAWKPIEAKFGPCDAKEGKATCELAVPEPLKQENGKPSEKILYRPTAKHSYSEPAQGLPLEAVPGKDSPFDSVIFYSPARQEYLCFDTEEEYKSLLPEIDLIHGLQGLTRKALETQDEAERKKLQEDIDAKVTEAFDGEVVGDASAAVEELLLIRRNKRWGDTKGWVYIRPYAKKNKSQVKGHWRKDQDATLRKNLEDLLKKAPGSKEHSPLFESDFKAKLFATEPLKSKDRLLWKWPPPDKTTGTKPGDGAFSFAPEAAICRLSMNWTLAEASVNLKERKIRIGSSGSAAFALAEGKFSAKYALPEKGINLLGVLQGTKYVQNFLDQGRVCLLRLNVELTGKAFAGLTVAAAFSLPEVDLSQVKADGKGKSKGKEKGKGSGITATVDASAEGFAGVQAGAGLEVAAEWAQKAGDEFSSLGSCGVEGSASAGLGGKAEWKIEYREGKFHFEGGAGLTVGLGGKAGFSFELEVEEGFRFMGYLLHCVDYHYVKEITPDAFKMYADYAFTLLTMGWKALVSPVAVTVEVISHFPAWFRDLGNQYDKVKAAIGSSSVATGTLSNVPPEALGKALFTIMKVREEDDFRLIWVYLNATVRRDADPKTDLSANHKLKRALQALAEAIDPEREGRATDAEKEASLKAGIKRIEDFGMGIGYVDKDGINPKPDAVFLGKIDAFFRKYKVK